MLTSRGVGIAHQWALNPSVLQYTILKVNVTNPITLLEIMFQKMFQKIMTQKFWLTIGVCLSLSLALISGCSTTSNAEDGEAALPADTVAVAFPDLPRLEGLATVELVVQGKDVPIIIKVDGEKAPVTAGNFIDLVEKGFYDGLVFHRVVREPQPFVVQGGDPQSKDPNFPPERLGTGGYIDPATGLERSIPLEILPVGAETPVYSQTLKRAGINQPPQLNHERGAVAMARSQFPDSASSQFYFALADVGFLDGDYAVFGYVTEGMEVVDSIVQGDRIKFATVVQGAENLVLP